MFNHVMIGANDIERTKEFYNAVLGVLGAGEPMEHANDNGSTFSISEPINGEPVDPSNGSTLGFVCDSPVQIQEFHDVAIANGGRSVEDPPGPREGNMGLMYLCYFLDPNGHKICGIHRPA